VLREALTLASVGIAAGVAGALLLTRSLTSLLYQVSPTDPAVLAGTCVAILVIAALASYVPARRAMQVDPMVALRAE
jgi:ABC-type antimicrobial peptide transport system permease subunit